MDINIHTLCLSLDIGPMAFAFSGDVERLEAEEIRVGLKYKHFIR